MFYLPIFGLGLPSAFVIASGLVVAINYNKLNKQNYKYVKPLIVAYLFFFLFRCISWVFVENESAFMSYLFVTFSVLIHILIVPGLVSSSEDIPRILKFWGLIGALSSILGFIHFQFQDVVYLRRIFTASGAFDKSTIDGSFDFVRWLWAGAEPNFTGLQLLIPFTINLNYSFKEKGIVNIVLLGLTFLGILGTYSRTSLIVALIILMVYFFMLKSNYKYFAIFIIPIAFGGIYVYFPEFIDRALSIQEAASSGQASGRYPLYKEAVENFLSNPLFGIGTGQTAAKSFFHLESHNLYLQTLGENGIISFVILLNIFVKYLRTSFDYRHYHLAYFVGGLAVMINANTVSVFDLRTIFMFFILMFLEVSYVEKNSNNYV